LVILISIPSYQQEDSDHQQVATTSVGVDIGVFRISDRVHVQPYAVCVGNHEEIDCSGGDNTGKQVGFIWLHLAQQDEV